MKAVDTNILVYSHRFESKHNKLTFELLGTLANGVDRWAIPWPCLHEFYAVVTHPKIWKGKESTPKQALRQIEAWTSSPSVMLLTETETSLEVLSELVLKTQIKGPAIHDARIAALCLVHGVEELITADRDFSRFPSLRCRTPWL